jgi:hypothetical protein
MLAEKDMPKFPPKKRGEGCKEAEQPQPPSSPFTKRELIHKKSV